VLAAATPSGATINVAAGDDLQSALDRAQPGDEIVLAAGATFTGNFRLPNKPGAQYITLRSAGTLPEPGARMTPALAQPLAKLVGAGGNPALVTDAGAHHFRVLGVEVQSTPGVYSIAAVALGSASSTDASQLPHDLLFDRVYIHGDAQAGVHYALSLNSGATVIANSTIADAKGINQEAQAIVGWNGPGPFTILNNELEGAGENIMFGGEDPAIAGLIPSDITIQYNHITKPLQWKPDDASYAGTHWLVKNLIELKNARRVTIDANVLEQCWADAQKGGAVLFTVRNQNGGAPWSTVESVRFTNNIVRHAGSGLGILGHDNNNPSALAHDFVVTNNLFYDIGGVWGGFADGFIIDSGTDEPGPSNVTIDHNTVLQMGNLVVSATPGMVVNHPGFVFTNNIANNGPFGIKGDSVSGGDATLASYFVGATVTGNVLVGAAPSAYAAHAQNYFPASLSAVPFADPSTANYSTGGAFGGAGVDWSALVAAGACRSP
jgi:hypothetical protein